jgi:two-component system, OmpR family, KDP operon response regulator KdpE
VTAAETALIVEDDAPMRRFLRTTLGGHGLRVVEAASLAEARRRAVQDVPTLALVDLGLPDGDGIELVQEIRRWSRLPIVVLSARGREDDKIGALDAGADDYLTKPFGVGELLARVRVALRHIRGAAADGVLEVGPIRIDQARHDVTVAGAEVHLTPIEYRLLALLARSAGRIRTHRELLREVWGPNAAQRTHYLRVHMAALRRKIEVEPARPRWLLTEAGIGYRLRDA